MFRSHPYFEDAAGEPAGGVGTPSTPPATPPAAASMSMLMPTDGLPDSMSMYAGKTMAQAFDGVTAMRTSLTEATNNASTFKTQNETLTAKVAELTAGQIDPDAAPIAPDAFGSAMNHYMEHGVVDPEFVTSVYERGALIPKQELTEFFEYKRAQRATQFEASQEWLNDNGHKEVDYRQLHAFLADTGKNDMSIEQLQAFEQMSKLGNMSWMEQAMDRFNNALGRGLVPQQFAAPSEGLHAGGINGKPTGNPRSGYQSQAEFQEALTAAHGDRVKEAAVEKKLNQSDADRWPDRTQG